MIAHDFQIADEYCNLESILEFSFFGSDVYLKSIKTEGCPIPELPELRAFLKSVLSTLEDVIDEQKLA